MPFWICLHTKQSAPTGKPRHVDDAADSASNAKDMYGIRLNWIHLNPSTILGDNGSEELDQVSLTNRVTRRSLASIGASSIPRLPSPDINLALSKIDEWDRGQQNPDQGGFSVFAISSPPLQPPFPELERPHASPIPFSPTVHTAHASETDQTWTPPANAGDVRAADTVPAAETLLSLGSNGEYAESPISSLLLPKTRTESHVPRHLDILSVPSDQKRLIHHWVTFTSRKLVLIDEPHNPCRIMMLPMALKGLMSRSGESNANVAIFHALCASAASNLYNLGNMKNEQDRVLALNHDQQAITHLRNNLSEADSHQDQSFAMAIMACIAADAISGTTSRWRTHVTGGLAYLAKLHARGLDAGVVAAFQRHMVSMAILCEIPVPEHLKSFLENEASAESLEFTFPYYGVSRSFLHAYDRMTKLGTAAHDLTPELEKELDAFQLQQYLDFPTLPPQEMMSPDQCQGLVLHHTAQVFYYARLVFFQRSIRRAGLDTVQSLVELGIHELVATERVGRGELGNMMLWPVIVLGAECDTTNVQDKMRMWFKNQRKLGFRNLVVLEEMIESLWTARRGSSGSGRNVDWRDVITLPQFDVFRL
ncbi:hypothetical protein EsDP_00002505 [Epichloe bromicola]|uniref:Uncharacterized protein n=1 Tax=Epichloe bromicola TaxID=79588 RepID=A0ABQ0CL08_9HYPO